MMFLYRLGNYFYRKRIPLLPKFFELLIFLSFNSRIPSDASIGSGSYFAYNGLSTLLAHGTVIGDNCMIGIRVTTCRNFPYKNVPKIGNQVWIGVNAVISGPIIIEDDTIIAANSFVNKSVPKGAIVAGTPARIIGWTKDLGYNIFETPKYKDETMPFLKFDQ